MERKLPERRYTTDEWRKIFQIFGVFGENWEEDAFRGRRHMRIIDFHLMLTSVVSLQYNFMHSLNVFYVFLVKT